ncbi:MAG: hypothetical protein K6F56_10210 [Oscillospiraceae bacterium]|nr:hypothetical protein [Oscillospiraceae bacterium]
MIKAVVEVERIDYEQCIENLLPRFVQKCASEESPSELDKIVARLDKDAVPVAKKIIRYLDQDARDQIIIALIEPHGDRLVQTANAVLEEMLGGKAVVVGGFDMTDLPGPRMTLRATQVRIDYAELANSPLFSGGILGSAAKLALQMASPATIEKQTINILASDLIKPKLLSALSEALQKVGLIVSIRDLTIQQDTDTSAPAAADKDEGLLPDAVEDRLIDAVIAWMKESL